MPKLNKQQITEMAEKGPYAPQTLSIQFVSHLIEEGFKGVGIDIVVNPFFRNRAKIIGGVLGSGGIAAASGAIYGVLNLSKNRHQAANCAASSDLVRSCWVARNWNCRISGYLAVSRKRVI